MAQTSIDTGFVQSGDERLFWRAVGDGPAMICCNGVGVSTFFWKYVVEHFSRDHRVIVWDYVGHGRSDRPADPLNADLSVPRCADDLGRVLDAAGAGDAVLLGHSMGCQVILEYALRAPDRVRGLVPILGSAGRVLDTFYNQPRSYDVIHTLFRAARRLGPTFNILAAPLFDNSAVWSIARRGRLVDPYYTRPEDLLPYTQPLSRLDFRLFLGMVLKCHEHDAFPHLGEIGAPALVIAAERDYFTPLHVSERMVSDLVDAELMVLADGTHAALIEQPATLNHRVARFLREKVG